MEWFADGVSLEETNLDARISESVRCLFLHVKRWLTEEGKVYFYENLCRLSNDKLYDLMKWLILELRWLTRQLCRGGWHKYKAIWTFCLKTLVEIWTRLLSTK